MRICKTCMPRKQIVPTKVAKSDTACAFPLTKDEYIILYVQTDRLISGSYNVLIMMEDEWET